MNIQRVLLQQWGGGVQEESLGLARSGRCMTKRVRKEEREKGLVEGLCNWGVCERDFWGGGN